MRFIWRVFLTGLFPIAGHLCLLLAKTPGDFFNGFYILEFSARWFTAALLVQLLASRGPVFLTGIMTGALIGANVGLIFLTIDQPIGYFWRSVMVHGALGILLGAGAWIAVMTFPPKNETQTSAAE